MFSENQSIITWRPISQRPEDGSYILLKCLDESGQVVCESASYEKGNFLYIYDRTTWGEVNEDTILGWAYYPFDEREYPHKTAEEKAESHTKELPEVPHPSFEEFYQNMMSRRCLILLPERIQSAERFIKTAVEVGEIYELDTKIERMDSHISVTYQFNCGGEMDHLISILRLADTVSFFTDPGGFDITLVLDYYTHAVYQGERLIRPPYLTM